MYLTKWTLTKGILVAEAEQVGKEHVVVRGAVPWQDFKFGLGDWHTSSAVAIGRAMQMRDKKVAQLEAQAKALRELEFTVPDLV